MSRKPNWPPQPHIHAKSGQWRVSWRGKHYYLGKPDSPEARAAYAELLGQLAVSQTSQPAAPTPVKPAGYPLISVAVAQWYQWAETHYGEARELTQFQYSTEPLLTLFGSLTTDKFDVGKLEEVREEMGRRGLCRDVINRRIVRIRTVWRWLERRGVAPKGSWAHLRTLAALGPLDREYHQRPPVQAITWRDLSRVCRMLRPTVRAMLLLQWFTGARSGEIRQMRVGEVDRSESEWIYRPLTHKNAWRGQSRDITIGPVGQRILLPFLAGRKVTQHVFESGQGRCYTDCSYSRAVARAAARAGITMHPYQARHAAKQRITREMGLDFARAQLGQKSIGTTDNYSSETDLEMARRAARKLG